MREFTVKDLAKFANKAIQEGHGDKVIFLSDDDEGNGYHQMFYQFTPVTDLDEQLHGLDKENHIILG